MLLAGLLIASQMFTSSTSIGPATAAAQAAAVQHSLLLNGNSGATADDPAPDLNLTGDWTIEGWFKENRAGGQDESPTTVRELVSKGPLGTAEVPLRAVSLVAP